MIRPIQPMAALLSVALLGLSAIPVLAVAPGNDDSASPIVIDAIPYTNTQGTSEATTGSTDPGFCYEPDFGADRATVWYEYTPVESIRLEANTFGSDYDTTLYVGTPDLGGGIDVIDCNDDTFDLQSRVRFDAEGGVTYLFMVGTCCGPSGHPGGGSLVFNLDVASPFVPVELSLSLDTTASFDRNGVATLSGVLTCSGADFVELYGSLRQDVGRFSIQGSGWGSLTECSSEGTPWQVQIWPSGGKFAGGRAFAYVEAYGWNDQSDAYDSAKGTVRLRK